MRRWRFDYAFPSVRVAVEIDGGVWINGRHNRPSGYLRDMEKFNAAASLGWLVQHFTPQEKFRRTTFAAIAQAIDQQTQNPAIPR